jgi:LAO/AO transport system kinase
MCANSDDGVYIRSLPAPTGGQSIADHLQQIIELVKHFGFDVVLLETAGAGQNDTAIRQLADVVVLLVQPESGDELQWEKAGVLEIADIVVVHKADLPGAENVASQLRASLSLPVETAQRSLHEIPVLKASATKNQGFAELWANVTSIYRSNRKAKMVPTSASLDSVNPA